MKAFHCRSFMNILNNVFFFWPGVVITLCFTLPAAPANTCCGGWMIRIQAVNAPLLLHQLPIMCLERNFRRVQRSINNWVLQRLHVGRICSNKSGIFQNKNQKCCCPSLLSGFPVFLFKLQVFLI